jgi:hypothetical protein
MRVVEMSEAAMNRFTAPRDGVVEGRLELIRGGTHVTVATAAIDELCRAEFEGVPPKASVRAGRVTIEYPRFSAAELLRHPAHRARIELTRALPWSLVFIGGLGESSIDLTGVELADFEITGGASDLRVALPAPHGVTRVRIGGGASKVTFLHPEGASVRLRIAGGATKLDFDARRFDAIGGATRLETMYAGEAADRYEIDISGGASRLTVAADEDAGYPPTRSAWKQRIPNAIHSG